jgi:hypothetical protein
MFESLFGKVLNLLAFVNLFLLVELNEDDLLLTVLLSFGDEFDKVYNELDFTFILCELYDICDVFRFFMVGARL